MAKRKQVINLPDVSKEHYYITKRGVKVFPVWFQNKLTKRWNWHICIDNNGTIQMFDKIVSKEEINMAVNKTILYYYERINEK